MCSRGPPPVAVSETPRRRIEAITRGHLAELAVEVGAPGEAKAEFEQAGRLFEQLQQPSDRRYRILAEISLARAELAAGAPQAAAKRLEEIGPSAQRVGAALVQIGFQQVLGDSFSLTGQANEAESAYRRAIDLSEHQLGTLRGFRERAQLMRAAGKAYRGVIELMWNRGDHPGALRLWEWFRAGEGPERQRKLDLDQRRSQLREESFLTYAMLPSGPVAWLFDDRGIEGRRLSVKSAALETVASRFLRECAEPGSDRRALQRDARQLYDWLVAPPGIPARSGQNAGNRTGRSGGSHSDAGADGRELSVFGGAVRYRNRRRTWRIINSAQRLDQ